MNSLLDENLLTPFSLSLYISTRRFASTKRKRTSRSSTSAKTLETFFSTKYPFLFLFFSSRSSDLSCHHTESQFSKISSYSQKRSHESSMRRCHLVWLNLLSALVIKTRQLSSIDQTAGKFDTLIND